MRRRELCQLKYLSINGNEQSRGRDKARARD
jgi:hypothetical protein